MRIVKSKTLHLACLIAVAWLGVSGCDASNGPGDDGSTARVSSAAADPRVPSGVLGELEDPQGALRDLEGFECARKGQRWLASGTLENASADAGSYVVTVTLVRPETSEVVARQARTLVVESGGRAPFELEFPKLDDAPKAAVQCVPRVVRGSESPAAR